MSRAQAASRLGAPLVACRDGSRNPVPISSLELCSLSCLVKRGSEPYYAGRCSIAERWTRLRTAGEIS